MADKRMTAEQVIGELRSGMTLGIGGWGSRRKPMALVRALLRSDVTDLTVVSYGGPDVGLLCAAGKVRRLVFGFVSLDSIPLEPHFQAARKAGTIEVTELDEGMLQWGLYAASLRLPFLPTRAGLGSDVMRVNPDLRTVTSPYASPDGYEGEELLAVPALHLDVALIHQHRADQGGVELEGGHGDELVAVVEGRRDRLELRVVAQQVGAEADARRQERHPPRRGLEAEEHVALVVGLVLDGTALAGLAEVALEDRRVLVRGAGDVGGDEGVDGPLHLAGRAEDAEVGAAEGDDRQVLQVGLDDGLHQRHRLAPRAPTADADGHAALEPADDVGRCHALVHYFPFSTNLSRCSSATPRRLISNVKPCSKR
jgi:acyl CoA:acetate/3-ketoacid CoA transferase alpha subunit